MRTSDRPTRSRRRRTLAVETLESRRLLAVSAEEQLFVYLLNRARHDPVAYQLENNLPVDLSGVSPRPPLAVNGDLFDSSEFHASEMAANNYFGHQSQVTGDWPNRMARDQGYVLDPSWTSNDNYIESLAAGTVYSTASAPLSGLIVDAGVPSLGHRNHLLGMDSFTAGNREIGVGHAFSAVSTYSHYWAIHATRTSPNDRFLTGVVFNDANANGRYDLNEGLTGVTVTAGGQSTLTNAAGGWSIKVASGGYTITAAGGGFSGTAMASATVGNNVEVDFISGRSQGVVDFVVQGSFSIANDLFLIGSSGSSSVSVGSGVLANDNPPVGHTYTASLVMGPAHGALTLRADGSFTYTPGAGFQGLDRFSYRALDGGSNSNPATVTLLSTQASLVRKLYQQVLGRDPDDAGLQFWTGRVLSGRPYSDIAQGIFESDERLNPIIGQYYQDYLLRPVDAAGLAYWRDQVWKRDGGPENVVAGMIGSAEFFQSAGGTNPGWVVQLYQRLLGRTPDDEGMQYWQGQLDQQRQTRAQVVLGFVRSDENYRNLIAGWYTQYLGRSPLTSELTTQLANMRAGASQRQVQISLIDSAEYRSTPTPPAPGAGNRLT